MTRANQAQIRAVYAEQRIALEIDTLDVTRHGLVRHRATEAQPPVFGVEFQKLGGDFAALQA
jgi:hypothetical protein